MPREPMATRAPPDRSRLETSQLGEGRRAVGVGKEDQPAGGVHDPGSHRVALAAILGQPDQPYPLVLGLESTDDFARSIRGAVVDDNDFDAPSVPIEERTEVVQRGRKSCRFVIGGDHHREGDRLAHIKIP